MDMVASSDKWDIASNAAVALNNIGSHYISKEDYETAELWIARSDSMAERLYADSEAPASYKGTVRGISTFAHVRIAQGLNRPQEAKQYFEEYQKTSFAQSAFGHVKSATYYYLANRYQEFADAYQWLDQMFKDYNFSPTFDAWGFVTEKFRANLKAGRKDSALAVALYAMDFVDTALVRQQNSEAARLATIYETKQKDEEIAQQQIDLSRQRFLALAVALVLLTVFFIVYTVHRRRVAKRLAGMQAAQERMESELRIARDIQMSMLPSKFPEREGLDLYASMTPARAWWR